MTDASPKVGGLLPTSLNVTRNWSEWVLWENEEITCNELAEYFCTGNKAKFYCIPFMVWKKKQMLHILRYLGTKLQTKQSFSVCIKWQPKGHFTHACSLLHKQYIFILPVKDTPDFITNSNNLNFLPGCCKVSRLTFYLFSNRGVNSTTEPSVWGHTDNEVLLLVFRSLNISLFIKS